MEGDGHKYLWENRESSSLVSALSVSDAARQLLFLFSFFFVTGITMCS